jgi:hypothetical protein
MRRVRISGTYRNQKEFVHFPVEFADQPWRITRTSVPNENGFKICNTLKVEVAAIFNRRLSDA